MKKTWVALFMLVTLSSVLFAHGSVGASGGTNRSSGPGCKPVNGVNDDVDLYPFGFMCGTNADYHGPLVISGINDFQWYSGGTTLNISAGWSGQGTPKKNDKKIASGPESMLTWVTIRTSSNTNWAGVHVPTASISPAGGNNTKACPGNNSIDPNGQPGPGKVWGDRDIKGDYNDDGIANGVNQSPVAYNYGNGGTGVINCQPDGTGKMVYWKETASGTASHSFDLKLDDDFSTSTNQSICLRLNVAMRFDGDTSWFPSPSSADNRPTDAAGSNSRITATHMVKQSRDYCFGVTEPASASRFKPHMQVTCDKVSGIGTVRGWVSEYGLNSSGAWVYTGRATGKAYRLGVIDPPPVTETYIDGGVGNLSNASGGNPGGEYTETFNAAALIGNGNSRRFILHVDSGANPWPVYNFDYGAGLDCLRDPPIFPPPAISCIGGITGNATDPDNDIALYIDIYDGPNGTGNQIAHILTDASNNFTFDLGPYRDGNDHTFSVVARDSDGVPGLSTGFYNLGLPGCGWFTLEPGAGGSLLPSDEDPTDFTVLNTITANYGVPGIPWLHATKPDVSATATNWLTKAGGNITGSGFPTYTTFRDRNFNSNYPIPPGSFIAGNEYCSHITIGPYQGVIQRNNSQILFIGQPSKTANGCDTVNNKPFFKVYGGSVSAGGNFTETGSCGGGGVLSGFYRNDSVNPAFKYGQGSSTELAALGIGQVTGFASNLGFDGNQLDSKQSPIELTFANQGVSWPIQSDPKLGGLYGGDHCLDNAEPPSKTGAISDTYSDGKEITATTIPKSENRSIFVNGDIYISGDIKYESADDGTWNVDNVPSLVVKAKGGNIYIDNDVKNLDGLYIAEATGAAINKGQIYTCAEGLAQVPRNELYDKCYKQLTVHGSFVARKVNLMRTYGSLRDERPTSGTPAQPVGPATPGVTQRPNWSENGIPPGYSSAEGVAACRPVTEAAEYPGGIWTDNWLCLSKADVGKGVEIGWSNTGTIPNDSSGKAMICENLKFIQNMGENPAHTWADNNLCSNLGTAAAPGIQVGTAYNLAQAEAASGGPWLCDQMYDNGDHHIPYWQKNNNIKIYICLKKFVPGGGGSAAVLPAPKNPLVCSNRYGPHAPSPFTDGRSYAPLVAGRPDTCAAEVFDFSPEFYLAQPSVNPPSGGAIIYDAITSLPPVL